MPADTPSQEQLQKVYDHVVKTYSNRRNVTGVDVGFRYDKGKRTDQMAVRVHVREKIPESALEAEEILPKQIEGVPIDVIQAVYKAQSVSSIEPETEVSERKSRREVIQPGISLSLHTGTAGTLGCIVYDRKSRRPGLLSNWHVLVRNDLARRGDAIVQPGRNHGGRTPDDTIARLERFILNRHGDAAVALLTAARQAKEEQFESKVHVTSARDVKVGERVEKSGQSTGLTQGLVDGKGMYTLDYSVGTRSIDGFKVVFEDQSNPEDKELSSGGDSGALWYSVDDHAGVGLHFAGETASDPSLEHALACHLPDVLEQLAISLTPPPEGVVPPPADQPQELAAAPAVGFGADSALMLETIVRLTRLLESAMKPGAVNGKSPSPARRRRSKPKRRRK